MGQIGVDSILPRRKRGQCGMMFVCRIANWVEMGKSRVGPFPDQE